MNELLKRIAEQAATEAAKYCQRPFDLSKEENETFALCFAEMVVRECCEVAHCNFHVDGLALGTILREHFGVEE